MSRALGVTEFLSGLVPEWALPAVLVMTMLAEAPVVVALVVGKYWFDDRDAGLRLVVIVATAYAVMLALKHGFQLPRPPAAMRASVTAVPAPFDAIYRELLDTSESGFPSGHTTIAAAAYGGAAMDADDRPRWLAVAAVLVVLVGGSRILLAVHYLVDVVAGLALGAGVIAAMRLADRWLDAPVGALAVGVACVFLAAVSAPTVVGVAAGTGIVVGAALALLSVDVPDDPWTLTASTVESGFAALGAAALALSPVLLVGRNAILVFVVVAVATGVLVAAPAFDAD